MTLRKKLEEMRTLTKAVLEATDVVIADARRSVRNLQAELRRREKHAN